jgi:hypothetical protein
MVGMGVVHAQVPEVNHCGNSSETYVAIIGPMCRDQGKEIREKRGTKAEKWKVKQKVSWRQNSFKLELS